MRFLPALLACTLLASATPGHARAKRHSHSAALLQAQALHRIHLAAKEKKAWHEHLAKVRSLPHSDRIAEKRHERLWQRKHNEKVAEKSAAEQAKAKVAERAQARQEKLARRHHAKEVVASEARSAPKKTSLHARKTALLAAAHEEHIVHEQHLLHEQHIARREHSTRQENAARQRLAERPKVTAHQENVAHRLALARAHTSHLIALAHLHAAHLAALHQQRLAKSVSLHRVRLALAHAAHNARANAGRARWDALHGDGGGSKSIRFWQTAAAGVAVKVISVDLNDPNIKVSAVMSAHGNGTSEPFRQMIQRANPNVAVTGTFFSLDDLQPVGDIVIDGSLVHFGGMGTALCITPGNRAEMVRCQWGRHHDWSPFDFVVACGPRLLHDGKVVLNPRAERFHDKHMLAPNSRIAVGITHGNTLFFVMTRTPISLGKLARAMQALGAADAMNLDAGTSTGFYYDGATLARPGRRLTNMIVVYSRRDRYEHALSQLAPASYRRSASRIVP